MRRLGFTGRMLTPGVIVLAALSILPLLTLIAMSFSDVGLIDGFSLRWAGLANWSRLVTDGAIWHSWGITALYLIATIGLELVLGVAIALGLFQLSRARSPLLSLLLLPMFVAPVIVGLLGRYLTDATFGLYTWVLGQLGWQGDLLGSGTTALISVILMDVWEWTPLLMLVTLAGLTSMNVSVVEAASLDGASGWRMLRHITLPSISGVLLVGLLIRSMDAIRYFDIIQITTTGGPADATKTAPVRLFETAFRFFDVGYASVIGLVMLVFTILIARAFIAMLGEKGDTA